MQFPVETPIVPEQKEEAEAEDLAEAIKRRLALDEVAEKQSMVTEPDQEKNHRDEALARLIETPKKATSILAKPASPDEDLSPTVKAFRERIKNEGPLYKPDMSPSRLRKRVSTSLLGEPYWPNPNPVGGSNRAPAWKPSDSSSMLESSSSKRQSPLASSFQLDAVEEDAARPPLREGRRNITPVSSKSAFKSSVVPPSIPSSVYGEARRPSTQAQPSGKRFGSIGKTDGRKLGKHLPRIASGDQFTEDWEEERAKAIKPPHTRDSSVTASSPLKAATKEEPDVPETPSTRSERPASMSSVRQRQRTFEEVPSTVGIETPSLVSSPRRPQSYVGRTEAPLTPKRILPDGRGMQGLVGKGFATPKASPGLVDTPGILQRSGSVAGVKGRLRLSRLPASSTSASIAPAPLPSKRLNMNWMDRQRKELIAYEYLCHVGEAQQWIEGCLDEELGYGVVEMEESMTDGVALAKLARIYEGEEVVRHIWEVRNKRTLVSVLEPVGLPANDRLTGQETSIPPI